MQATRSQKIKIKVYAYTDKKREKIYAESESTSLFQQPLVLNTGM